jgi:hypothetical protein
LTVVFQPWIRGAADQPVAVPTSYRVKLRIVPYLITPTSVADEQKRRALLGTTDRGAVLRFDFMELYNLGYGAPVSCSSSNYNLIDSRVLTKVYDTLASQPPLVLPAQKLTTIADTMLSTPADTILGTPAKDVTTQLTGMTVGSDGDLRIGLRLDQGTTRPFPATALPVNDFGRGRLPQNSVDWVVELDPSFVTAVITSKVTAEVAARGPDFNLDSPGISVQFLANDAGGPAIDVTATGTMKTGCLALPGGPLIHWASKTHIDPLVRKRTDGSIVVAPTSQTNTTDVHVGTFFCAILDGLWNGITHPLGQATITVNPGGLYTGGVYAFPLGKDPVEFDAAPGDHFYATSVDTDTLFSVGGRSTSMDVQFPRPPVPIC